MKQIPVLIICTLAVLMQPACTKEKEDGPKFLAPGYWRGNAFIYHTAILNRSNGTSRLYYVIQGYDTTLSLLTKEGVYSVNNGVFKAAYPYGGGTDDSIFIESTTVSPSDMSGLLISSLTGEAAEFKLRKQ